MFSLYTHPNMRSMEDVSKDNYKVSIDPLSSTYEDDIIKKILAFERTKGGPGGTPLPHYTDDVWIPKMKQQYLTPEIQALPAGIKERALDFYFNSENPMAALMEATGTLTPQQKSKMYPNTKLDVQATNDLWSSTGKDAFYKAYKNNQQKVIKAFDKAKLRSYSKTLGANINLPYWTERTNMWGNNPNVLNEQNNNNEPLSTVSAKKTISKIPPFIQNTNLETVNTPTLNTDNNMPNPPNLNNIVTGPNGQQGYYDQMGNFIPLTEDQSTVFGIQSNLMNAQAPEQPTDAGDMGGGSFLSNLTPTDAITGLAQLSTNMSGKGVYDQKLGIEKPSIAQFGDLSATGAGAKIGGIGGAAIGFGVDFLKNMAAYKEQNQQYQSARQKYDMRNKLDTMQQGAGADYTGLTQTARFGTYVNPYTKFKCGGMVKNYMGGGMVPNYGYGGNAYMYGGDAYENGGLVDNGDPTDPPKIFREFYKSKRAYNEALSSQKAGRPYEVNPLAEPLMGSYALDTGNYDLGIRGRLMTASSQGQPGMTPQEYFQPLIDDAKKKQYEKAMKALPTEYMKPMKKPYSPSYSDQFYNRAAPNVPPTGTEKATGLYKRNFRPKR